MPKPTEETAEQKRERETIEAIAQNISKLANAVGALLKGPLKRRALLLLLASSSGLGLQSVDKVLIALENMEKDWLK
jgi:hypothetical protein